MRKTAYTCFFMGANSFMHIDLYHKRKLCGICGNVIIQALNTTTKSSIFCMVVFISKLNSITNELVTNKKHNTIHLSSFKIHHAILLHYILPCILINNKANSISNNQKKKCCKRLTHSKSEILDSTTLSKFSISTQPRIYNMYIS